MILDPKANSCKAIVAISGEGEPVLEDFEKGVNSKASSEEASDAERLADEQPSTPVMVEGLREKAEKVIATAGIVDISKPVRAVKAQAKKKAKNSATAKAK